ncbi:M14 family metallopeptidase [Alkalicoccus daliensis]|uniref:Zinc carboxypeptidase n=1 Tax=Alkalicoccus daliensis TaxID=745820 RepID=A0A1H0FSA8_9BACI|nr:M14 family zinc carboxypeptidase [Alkalicoccus daliensis]SDN97442.1 Zinc carboxypeptidase [Alkalicoccus daliensis]
MKKTFSGLLAVTMLVGAGLPMQTLSAPAAEAVEAAELEVSRSLFSLTETRTVEVKADLGESVNPENIAFQFGGKNISEWRQWTSGTNYNGNQFIRVVDGPVVNEETNEVTATLEFGLLYNRSNLSNRTIRTQYQQFIGDYELAMIDNTTGAKAATEVTWNVYDEFLTYDELKPAIDDVFAEAEGNGRYLEYQSAGQSVEGRDIHFAILAKDEEAVDTYLEETLPTALENPESLIEELENGTMEDYQIPVWFNNIHPDEVEGVDAQVELFRSFALEEEVEFTNTNESGTDELVTLDVDEVLDDVIFLYMFTSNPDGRVANTRANAEGFDLNRDNAYQTQVETQQVNELVSKWTPLSFIDFHGYVNGFLIEPATPPHNPNFEYDLLIDNMMGQANAMGRAGIGSSDLTSYFIAKLGYGSGWDDMTPAYTAMYGMLHGSYSHTIELPTLSQNSYNAAVGSGLGATWFVSENKDELYRDQLEIFKRGVNNEDNRAVDEYFVNAAGESIGRVRGDNENFFPDYYVIPAAEETQKNVLEAYNMADYLLRNSIDVERTTQEVEIDGTIYPAGTFVVPMNQAKRGLANAVLYEGDNVSDWNAMYDPIVVNFPDLRGFDVLEVREAGLFTGLTEEIEEASVPDGSMTGNAPRQILKNNTNDTIKVVNALLADGKTVEVFTESKGKAEQGDYAVATNDLRAYADDYYFNTEALGNGQSAKSSVITQPKVAAAGSAQLRFSLRQLGFQLTDVAEADVVVSDSTFNANQFAGKDYIGIGIYPLNAVRNSGLLPGFNWSYTGVSHEGLVEAVVEDHQQTAGYEEEERLYVTTGSWITSVPEEAEVLASFKDTEDFYVAGWWPNNQRAQGQTMAFTVDKEDTTYTMFANELAFRAHTEHSYRLLSNSIYASVTAEESAKGNKGNNGKGKQNNVKVDKNQLKTDRSADKVKVIVANNGLAKAAKVNGLDKVTIASDRGENEDKIELSIPAKAVKDLKKAQPDAAIDLQFGGTSYVVPVADIDLDSLTKVSGNNYEVSIEVTEEIEEIGGRDLEPKKVKTGKVKVQAKGNGKSEEISSFTSFEE